jgi:hypothetical protein
MSARRPKIRIGLSGLLGLLLAAAGAAGQVVGLPGASAQKLIVAVTDENGVAVTAARVFLQSPPPSASLRCGTDFSGRCGFEGLVPGIYQLRVEKEGFYALVVPTVQVGATVNVDVTLSHLQEVREVVNVVESPPAIDPTQASSQEKLSGLDVINIPYPTTRDYRNALGFIPEVVLDVFGQPHIAGAETYQTLTLLDGFNVTQPATGQLLARVSTDAFRSIDVETSRYSAEQGKGSGGVLSLNTRIGDDHYRFAATNFVPSLQDKKGITLDKIDPRFTFSGPIQKGKMWFFDAADGEYDNIVITQLPNGADHDTFWRVGNLAKVQTNLTARNILTTSFNVNRLRDEHLGLSPVTPVEATPADDESAYMGAVKDQHYFAGGELLETGLGFSQYKLEVTPLGTAPYFVTPEATGGNYYFSARTRARRWQLLSNLYLRPRQWHGRHEVKFGLDGDILDYDAHFTRQPISFLREGQALPANAACLTVTPSPCSRYSVFPADGNSLKHNLELSGYAQDRWSPTSRLLIEAGLRFDWDEIVRHTLVSPRLATTYVLDNEGVTKLSAGIGIFYDATNLILVARPTAGERLDYFFDPNGNPVAGPVLTTYSVHASTLEAPRFLNWSVTVERKLPAEVYLTAQFLQKRGVNGFVYNTLTNAPLNANFVLQNTREDHYDAFRVDVRRTFRKSYPVMVSYTRSRAKSNQVVDFNVDNPVFSPQAAGPYPWDAPNRLVSWGLFPLIKGFDLGYSAEWRDGFPFNVVNDQEQLVEPPGSRRFPTYFSLNLSLEKRFHLFGFYWAVRGGFDDITGRTNPVVVDNNIDSPNFLTFFGQNNRVFTTRIRFLGRK